MTIKIKNLAMLWKIHGTNFFHIKFLDRTIIKSQNGPVLPPAQVFYFNGQALSRSKLIKRCVTIVAGNKVTTSMENRRVVTYYIYYYYYIHTYTYHSRFIPEGVAEVSQIFLRDTYVLPKLVSYEEHCRRDR
jgi:muramidase (phage lysozyme)